MKPPPPALAFGLVGRFAVIGSEAGLREVIGTTQGEAALSARRRLREARRGGARRERSAHLYVNPATGVAAAPPAGARPARPATGGRQVNISLVAGAQLADARRRHAGRAGTRRRAALPDPEARAGARRSCRATPGWPWASATSPPTSPGDVAGAPARWAACSAVKVAERRSSLGTLLGRAARAARSHRAPTQPRRAATSGAGAARRASSPPAASVLELKGAVVISSTDAARSRAAVGEARRSPAPGRRSSHTCLDRRHRSSAGRAPAGRAAAARHRRRAGLPTAPKFVLGLGEASVRPPSHPPKRSPARPTRGGRRGARRRERSRA